MTSAGQLAKTTGGNAVMIAAALGDALGRPVTGLEPKAANSRVPSSDAAVGIITPALSETDLMREAQPGTPSAPTQLALAAVESALCGPENGEELVADALRRGASLGWPQNENGPHGALIGPTPGILETIRGYANGMHPLSCGGAVPDVTLLVPALFLGALGTPHMRTALILRAWSRDPITLTSAVALAQTVAGVCSAEGTADSLVKDAKAAEELALSFLGQLPGSLAGPAQMGHGAVAMALARSRSAMSADDALSPLAKDLTHSPEVLMACALGALMVEPMKMHEHVIKALRAGGCANVSASVIMGVGAAVSGLKAFPLAWLGGLQLSDRIQNLAEQAMGRKKPGRLAFPAADVGWAWQQSERIWRQERMKARKSAPPPPTGKQMDLFGE